MKVKVMGKFGECARVSQAQVLSWAPECGEVWSSREFEYFKKDGQVPQSCTQVQYSELHSNPALNRSVIFALSTRIWGCSLKLNYKRRYMTRCPVCFSVQNKYTTTGNLSRCHSLTELHFVSYCSWYIHRQPCQVWANYEDLRKMSLVIIVVKWL